MNTWLAFWHWLAGHKSAIGALIVTIAVTMVARPDHHYYWDVLLSIGTFFAGGGLMSSDRHTIDKQKWESGEIDRRNREEK